MASTEPGNDTQTNDILEALGAMASSIMAHRGTQGIDKEDFAFKLELWELHSHLQRLGQPRAMTIDKIAQLFHETYRLDYVIQILDGLKKSATSMRKYANRQLVPITAKLSKGLALLPDELLALIFKFACPPRQATRQSVWLSHVSCRFRSIALGTHCLWTTWDGLAKREELRARITRSGSHSDLHIVLHGTMRRTALRNFLNKCLPKASRWKSLTVTSKEDVDDVYSANAVLANTFDRLNPDELIFPRLETLRFKQSRTHRVDPDVADTWSTDKPRWSTPNLRSIICDEYIPARSQLYSAMDSFSTSISLSSAFYPTRIKTLLTFIASLSAATSLDLTIRTSVNRLQKVNLTPAVYPSVTTLSLNFPLYIFSDEVDQLLHPFVNSMTFPHLTSLHVSLELRYEDLPRMYEDSLAGHVVYTPGYHYSILNSIPKAPNLTSYSFKLTPAEPMNGAKFDRRLLCAGNKFLSIPLTLLPRISTMEFQSFTDIKVFCTSRLGDDVEDRSALRTLRFVNSPEVGLRTVENIVKEMKEGNLWDNLESFHLESCAPTLRYSQVVGIVGEDKLRFIGETTGSD